MGNASGGLTGLGTLGGAESAGSGINDSGQVTGESATASGQTHAFLWTSSGGLTDLGALDGRDSRGTAINNSGEVTGVYTDTSGQNHAFVGNAASGLTQLGGAGSEGWGINNYGDVTGFFTNASGQSHAFVGNSGSGLTDLGTLGGNRSFGYGINDSGQVTGQSLTAGGQTHAFIGTATGGLTDLGALGDGTFSAGYAINNHGDIVGTFDNPGTGDGSHAFLWSSGLGMLDLNSLVGDMTGWSYLGAALGISDTGYITGVGETSKGQAHAFLLTPGDRVAKVPEPAALWLLIVGLVALRVSPRKKMGRPPHQS